MPVQSWEQGQVLSLWKMSLQLSLYISQRFCYTKLKLKVENGQYLQNAKWQGQRIKAKCQKKCIHFDKYEPESNATKDTK